MFHDPGRVFLKGDQTQTVPVSVSIPIHDGESFGDGRKEMIGGETGIGDQNQGDRASTVSDPDSKVGRFQSDIGLLLTFTATYQSLNYTGNKGDILLRDGLRFPVADRSSPGGGGEAGCPFAYKLPDFSGGSLPGEPDFPSLKIGGQFMQRLFGINQRNPGGELL
jgi:hypothetical protein